MVVLLTILLVGLTLTLGVLDVFLTIFFTGFLPLGTSLFLLQLHIIVFSVICYFLLVWGR